MELWDFEGCYQLDRDDELMRHLRTVRRGEDGAFVLSHGDDALSLHIHGDAAFLWYQPDNTGKHPGFVPDGMWEGEHREVRFLQTDGTLADSIVVPWWQLLSVEAAYRAAVEYLQSKIKPASVTWFEL